MARQDKASNQITKTPVNQARLEPAFVGFAVLLVDIARGGHSSTFNSATELDIDVLDSTNQDPPIQFNQQ